MTIFLLGDPKGTMMNVLRTRLFLNGFNVLPDKTERPISSLEADVCILVTPSRPIDYLYAGFLLGSGLTIWEYDQNGEEAGKVNYYIADRFIRMGDLVEACRKLRDEQSRINTAMVLIVDDQPMINKQVAIERVKEFFSKEN